MNLLTIIVCVILVISALIGLYRGFVGSLISMFFLVAVVLLTLLLTPFVSRIVAGSSYVTTYYHGMAEKFLSAYTTSGGSVDLSSLSGGSLQTSPFQAAAAVLSILLSASGAPALTTEKLVGFMIGVTATVITFILVFVILLIVRFVAGRRIRKSDTLNTADRFLGFLFGFVKGLVIVWIILAVIDLLAFVPQLRPVANQIPDSPILTWLNQNNLVRKGVIALISRMLN